MLTIDASMPERIDFNAVVAAVAAAVVARAVGAIGEALRRTHGAS